MKLYMNRFQLGLHGNHRRLRRRHIDRLLNHRLQQLNMKLRCLVLKTIMKKFRGIEIETMIGKTASSLAEEASERSCSTKVS